MKRQTAVGLLFILVGLALLVLVASPVIVAIRAHTALPDLSFSLVLTGLGTALFGAWLLPSSGVSATTVNILSVAGPYIPFGRRANSGEAAPPPPPTGTA
jgi:hypothetical protein